MKRLSYNWFWESMSTMFTTIVIVVLAVVLFDYFNESHKENIFDDILKMNLVATPIITLFGGLQPLINSGRLPKTLYLDESGQFYLNKTYRLDIGKIDKLIVVHLHAAEMSDHYYKILFKQSDKTVGESTSEPIYLAEKYNLFTYFTHFFKPKRDVLEKLINGGLSPDQVVDGEAASNFLFRKKK